MVVLIGTIAANLLELSLYDANLTSLQSVQYLDRCINLKSLNLHSNAIDRIENLYALTNLKELVTFTYYPFISQTLFIFPSSPSSSPSSCFSILHFVHFSHNVRFL
eukprot:TRINITY_DN3925_c1_g2_i1.p2 TRINITY_DN3925_c1_g2~~TRINITY_DN3925_c1_g2_i1.p2  ORF type:complete len:106 (+),score=2.70 TRINITY_DN3925_c1_g2_i1:229-546(+)